MVKLNDKEDIQELVQKFIRSLPLNPLLAENVRQKNVASRKKMKMNIPQKKKK